jgi:protein-export membrane protein SecD
MTVAKKNPSKLSVRQKLLLKTVLIVFIFLFFGGIVYPVLPVGIPGKAWFDSFQPKLGLDLQGGAHLVFEADTSQIEDVDKNSAVEGVRDVIERRVNTFGIAEPLIQTNKQGDNYRVIVELAGVFDISDAIKQIGETPLLEFKEQNPNFTGEINLTTEQQQILDQFNSQAREKAFEVLDKLNSGENFVSLAQEFSQDPGSKDQGGNLGFVKRGDLIPEFEEVIFDQLADGEIATMPVESQFGFHIIQKISEKGFGDTREVESRHILLAKISAQDLFTADDQWLNTQLSGKHLERAQLVFNQNTNAPEISLRFNDEGKNLFAEITKKNLNLPVAIFLDGQPISIPTVQSEITEGEAIISGDFTISEAKLLAQRLNAGALPVPISLVSQQTIGPTLGAKSIQQSIFAGIIGILAVVFFMLLYYRLLGFFAVISLSIYGVIVFGLFQFIPVTLTLAGIAGFILSLGMAVDANVLIFERIKEELKRGEPLDMALNDGFKRAWPAIRDSNLSTLITTVILFWFGTSIIKGFALTLSIGVLVSMFSAIFITKTLLNLFLVNKLGKYKWLFGFFK